MIEKPPEQHRDVKVQIHLQDGTDGQRYNLPTVNEIAMIIPGDHMKGTSDAHDIVLCLQDGQLQRSANSILLTSLFTIFCSFQVVRRAGIHKFLLLLAPMIVMLRQLLSYSIISTTSTFRAGERRGRRQKERAEKRRRDSPKGPKREGQRTHQD